MKYALTMAWMLAAAAVAQAGERQPLSIAAVEAKFEKRFAAIDADGDGMILPPEWGSAGVRQPDAVLLPWRPALRSDCAQGKDRDASQAFDRLDADGDGAISREEFAAKRNALRVRRGDASGAEGRRRAMRRPPFDRLDGDEDGVISRDEFNAPLERLRALDANGDGELDRAELRAGRSFCGRRKPAP